MNLDQPWKIAALIGLLGLLRIVWGLWRDAPARRFAIELLDSGIIAFALVFLLIRPFVVQAFYIPSESMEPTLLPRDRILVNRFIYRLNDPSRGDIIVFDAPQQALEGSPPGEDKRDFVKRLIGLPGDLIEIRRYDGVYINDTRLEEAPGVPLPDYDWPESRPGVPAGRPYRVPAGCYFVLGDNRNKSNDSHKWGDLPKERVLGKAMVIFYPLARIRLVGDNRQLTLQEQTRVAAAQGATAGAATY